MTADAVAEIVVADASGRARAPRVADVVTIEVRRE